VKHRWVGIDLMPLEGVDPKEGATTGPVSPGLNKWMMN